MKNFFAFIALSCYFSALLAQSDFVLYTRYDQLCVSPSRDSLAFRCVVLDESHPFSAKMKMLLLTPDCEQPICLNPQPERFAVSADGKYLLFSAPSGLFLMRLNSAHQVGQVVFRQFGRRWDFEKFGFADQGKFLFFKSDKKSKTGHLFHFFRLPDSPPFQNTISFLNLKEVGESRQKENFQLPLFEVGKFSNLSIARKKIFFGFVPDSLTSFAGDYFLIFKEKDKERIILAECRPRLLAPNPDSSKIFVAVFEKTKNKSFLFDPEAKKLKLFTDKLILSISWLDRDRFIFLADDGLFLHRTSAGKTEKLAQKGFPPWANIELNPPKYEIQFSFSGKQSEKDKFLTRIIEAIPAARVISETESPAKISRVLVGGFASNKQARLAAEKLKKTGYDFHIEKIDDLFDFFNNPGGKEQQPFRNGFAKIQYQKKQFWHSRIIYVDRGGNFQILVPPMNSFNKR